MSGFVTFLGKELREVVRTWRLWVIPGIVLFFALSGPPLALFTPEIIKSLSGSTGMTVILPEPTYVDAYLQWTKNLSQIVLFAVIITSGGMISAEKRSGTAGLMLTKPLTKSAFVVAKYVAAALLLVVSVAVGALATWGTTYAIFREAPVLPLVEGTMAWLALGLLFTALLELFSAAIDSSAAAAAGGFAAYALFAVGELWRPLDRYSPCGLVSGPSQLAAGTSTWTWWPVVSAVALGGLLVAATIVVFRRREL